MPGAAGATVAGALDLIKVSLRLLWPRAEGRESATDTAGMTGSNCIEESDGPEMTLCGARLCRPLA